MATAATASHSVAGHGHGDEEHPPPIVWSSKTPISIMGMLFFIGSECALFGAFFMAYFFIRVVQVANYGSWAEDMLEAVPIHLATYNSLILFSSSVTIHYASIAVRRSARGWTSLWVLATILLGGTFLGIQIYEYGNIVTNDKVGPTTNAYSSVFFSLTGLHGSHVLVGLILLSVIFIRSLRGHYAAEPDKHIGFETMGIYWHFVDLVWVFVFGLIYIPGNWEHFDWPIMAIGIAALAVLFFMPKAIGKDSPKHAH
jgi:cytochrome c oxidase subunit 3